MGTSSIPGTALITGASSGIGKEFARIHASRGGNLILTARRKDALEALREELERDHSIQAETIPLDLSTDTGPQELHNEIKRRNLTVDILINNAGFGGHGAFAEQDLQQNLHMVDLNIKSLMSLTHLVLNDMIAQGKGRILNVGSTAGMIPGPLHATYHASKAFVNSFSQAIASELKDTGITVTALAPGTVATDFFEKADMGGFRSPKQMASPQSVARIGYDAMMKGKLFVINDWKLTLLLRYITPFVPRNIILDAARQFSERPQ